MKKILILIFCISFFSAVYSQGVNENDENELYDRLTKCIIERDSLTKIDKVKTDSIALMTKEIARLKKDTASLHKQISKNKIEIDRLKKDLKNKSIKNKIYERDAEISRLKQDSANLQTEISGIKAEKEIYGKQRYSEGQTELVASVEKRYSDKEFDDLLRTISMKMVEEDIKIVTSPRLKLKMQDMLTYFKAELLCSEPYNETKVNKAKEDLSKIDNQTQMVKDMVRKLDKYKIYTDGLKKKVHSIAEMVRVLTSLGDDEIVPRQAEIFSEILYYRKNYPDYTYPYLESIIDELIKRKAKDINDDISDLESKL